jgi:hypothetical protein
MFWFLRQFFVPVFYSIFFSFYYIGMTNLLPFPFNKKGHQASLLGVALKENNTSIMGMKKVRTFFGAKFFQNF